MSGTSGSKDVVEQSGVEAPSSALPAVIEGETVPSNDPADRNGESQPPEKVPVAREVPIEELEPLESSGVWMPLSLWYSIMLTIRQVAGSCVVFGAPVLRFVAYCQGV